MRCSWRSCPPTSSNRRFRPVSKKSTTASAKPARILLPVRNLQFWIESNVSARSERRALRQARCAACSQRRAVAPTAPSAPDTTNCFSVTTSESRGTAASIPAAINAKLAAHVAKTVAAKPELVQISTAYGTQKEGSPVLPRNKYTAIRDDKPKSKDEAKRPEFKVCKFATDAIITEGSDDRHDSQGVRESRLPHPSPEEGERRKRERCAIQGRAGEAAQGGSHRQRDRPARSFRNRRGSPGAADETRPIVYCRTSGKPARRKPRLRSLPGSTASRRPRRTTPSAKLFTAFLRRADDLSSAQRQPETFSGRRISGWAVDTGCGCQFLAGTRQKAIASKAKESHQMSW